MYCLSIQGLFVTQHTVRAVFVESLMFSRSQEVLFQ